MLIEHVTLRMSAVAAAGRRPRARGGGPAGQQGQLLGGGRPWLRGVGSQRETDVGGQGQRVVVQSQVPDDRVVEDLDSAGVLSDVVAGPAGAELVAAGRELPDELGQRPVMWAATGFRAEDLHGDVGDGRPVVVEVARARIEEAVPGKVRWLPG